MAVQTAAGAKIYIGPANAVANTEAAYDALTFTLIGEVEDVGEFGDVYNEILFTAIDNRRVRKKKGSVDAGTLTLTVGFDPDDAGQSAFDAAVESDLDYAFRIELNDASEGGSPSRPTTRYFRGLAMGNRLAIGNVENIVRGNVSIGINSDIVRIAAI